MKASNWMMTRTTMAILFLSGAAAAQNTSPPPQEPPASKPPESAPGRLTPPDESGKPDAPAPVTRDASGKVEIRVLPEKALMPNPGDAPVMRRLQFVHGLGYRLPNSWKPEEPSNPMRLAQVLIPAAQGGFENGAALLTVTANIGGSIDDNIARWVAQFTQLREAPTLQRYTLGTLKVHELRATGTFNAKMPGAGGEDQPQPDTSMFAAIVEGGPSGPVFFKAVGPAHTMERRSSGWMMFLRNIGMDVRPDTQGMPRAPQDEAEQRRLREEMERRQRESEQKPTEQKPAEEKPAGTGSPASPGTP